MKLLLSVIYVIVQQAYAGVISNQPQALESGLVLCKDQINPGILQTEQTFHEQPHLFGVVEKTITIPEDGFLATPIKCILVEDLRTDGSGGVVSVIEGGVNQFRVTLHFISKWGKGIDYRIQVYV